MGNCFTAPPAPSAPSAPAPPTPPPAPPAPPAPSAPPAPPASALAFAPSAPPAPLDPIHYYQHATYENTPEYTLEGLRALVKILRVLDGDTVDIALLHPDTQRVYRHRVRLWGIDTPEKKPSLSDPHRHLEIEASYRAKGALEQRCQENHYLFMALFYHPDKYGRLMCTLYDDKGGDVNQWMVKQGYAVEYMGKTKKKFQAPVSPLVPVSPLALPEPALLSPAMTLSPSSR